MTQRTYRPLALGEPEYVLQQTVTFLEKVTVCYNSCFACWEGDSGEDCLHRRKGNTHFGKAGGHHRKSNTRCARAWTHRPKGNTHFGKAGGHRRKGDTRFVKPWEQGPKGNTHPVRAWAHRL